MRIDSLYPWRYVILLIVLAVLIWGLFRPSQPPQYFNHMDKWLHTIAFFGTALATRYATPQSIAWLAWLILLLAAPSLEYLQHQLQPSRSFNPWDILANTLGISLAWLIWPFIARIALPSAKPTP